MPNLVSQRTTDDRILVVEDERIVARDLANILTELGYEVVATVATGSEAILQARLLSPSLVLMDIRLSGAIDGVEASRQIRLARDVPVIFLTAHSDEDTLRRATATAPFGYLLKPFKAAELRCAIEIALHKHEIETRLREREQWLTAVLRSIGEGVVTTDAERCITSLNPIAESLTGWTQADATGRRLDEVLRLVSELTQEPVHGPGPGADTLLLGKHGAAVPVASLDAEILGDGGQLLGGVSVIRDISAQRRSLEEIRLLNLDLERRVLERTAQLEAANKDLEVFSYSIAHELRAPLRDIEGTSLALIEEHVDKLGVEGIEQLRRLRSVAQRAGRLVGDLLGLAYAASLPLHRRDVDISKLARLAQAELCAAHRDRAVEFVIAPDVTLNGDPHLLQTLVSNLVGNAWKFTGKVEAAKIEFGTTSDAGRTVCFVRDNGAGFDTRHAQQAFRAFQRFHSVAEFEGTGIGLAVVQRIVDRHAGSIWVTSEVGVGTTFFFSL